MDVVLLIARLLLALVFLVAGVGKLADHAQFRRALVAFGVPARVSAPLGWLLPLAELAVAVALVPTATAWWGALGALALLAVFVAAIGLNLGRGRKPECRCFGQLHSAPVGRQTLARNGVLCAAAALVVWQGGDDPGASALSWVGAMSGGQLSALVAGVVVLGLLGFQWWAVLNVLRQNGRLMLRVEALEAMLGVADQPGSGLPVQPPKGLPVGSEAPEFALEDLFGKTPLTLASLRALAKPVVLIFTDPGCGPCEALLPEIGRWQDEHHEQLTLCFVSRGDPQENRADFAPHGLTTVGLQKDWEVADLYRVDATPSAVLVRPEGTVGSPVVSGPERIRTLLAEAVGDADVPAIGSHPTNGHHPHPVPAGPKVGEPAPAIQLRDLRGETVALEDFKGKDTLVLFWNPGCTFCQQMLDDLRVWEADRSERAPSLLVVSAGALEANRQMRLASTVVLDQSFAAGRAFGASGTPSAVLVDAEGKVASELVVGARAILELADANRVRV